MIKETCYHDVVNFSHWNLALHQLRRAKGLTQARLGELAGLSASAVGMYEQGRRLPTSPRLSALCQGLGVQLGDFLALPDLEGPFAPWELEKLLKSLEKKCASDGSDSTGQENLKIDRVERL